MKSKVGKTWCSLLIIGAVLLGTQDALATISRLSATSDATNASYSYSFTGAPTFLRVFLDTDINAGTGYSYNGIGANYMIENGYLYQYSGSGGTAWGWKSAGSSNIVRGTSSVKFTVSRSSLGSPAKINLIANTSVGDKSAIVSQTLSSNSVTWTRCATEGGVCSFSGTRQVRYGANGIFAYKTATGSIGCNNTTFGDPVVGVTKYCDYSSVILTTTTTTVPVVTTTTLRAPTTTTTTIRITTTTTTTTTIPVASGPTYYVSPSGNDLNAGTASSPWRTIQKAANTVSAGATVILMDGTYEEPSIRISRSGTATAPITFKAQRKWMAVLASLSGCNPGISIYASYITLQDFRLSVSPRNANCSTYTSSNAHVRAWSSKQPTPSSVSTGYQGFVLRGMKVDAASARSEGIKSNQDYTIMENSEAGHSLELMNNRESIVRNNVVVGQSRHGISIFAKGGIRNARIYGNIIHQKVANGRAIIIGGYSCDACHFDTSTNIEAYNTVAYNNVIINESGGQFTALEFEGAKDSAFFNNVVINGQLGMRVGGHNTGPQAPVTNPTFKNNIVICSGASLTSSYFGWSYSGTLNMDYNNFYNCSSAPAQSHTISGNPMFVNQLSDWHLQAGSPAINAGTPISMPAYGGGTIDVSRDKDGVLRSAPWDLGIYNAN